MSLDAAAPEVVHVVVPVHDEEQRLGRCLTAIEQAVIRLHQATGIGARITVVLDRCRDGSAAVAARHDVDTVISGAGCVGVAREAGVDRVARLARGREHDRVWVAMTDADCLVGPGWLVRQHVLASDGFALVVGRVRPDPDEIDPALARSWDDRHRDGLHVHGANLGFTLAAHRLAGGFSALDEHEDVVFVRSAIAAGCRWTNQGSRVRTSARLRGRTNGGFAGYLRDLAAAPEAG
ncbi:glycosyl transferase family 2 [Mumia flava]|uniref:4,4'-diaponeurosporenoate glycosyltransferase n=1 Tax=Mumia flava TaxID=1348852 RepID=A0A0B2AYT2_9ACTN|nr:glycosyltransferase family A protein [Mumia flava]PJJ56144.1 glycosyl transferase family 2 [Mumia flava]